MTDAQLNKNLTLYPKFYILFHSYAWASVFFLYFLENLSIEKVLLLESFYYISVVLLEVPSGYFSDKVGRKPTLLIAAGAQVIAYSLFLIGGNISIFIGAQVFLAIAFSFASGTDQAFYYESVSKSKSKENYGFLEASLMKNAMRFRAFAQLVVGVLCIYTLKFGPGLSLIFSLISFFIVLNFKAFEQEHKTKESFFNQLFNCFKYWKQPLFLWVTFFIFIFTICTHFPYEFFQKYIDLLDLQLFKSSSEYSFTTLGTGIVASSAIFIASFFAGKSIGIKNKLGFKNTMILAIGVNALILFGMSYFLSSWILILILMRSIPSAISRAPLAAEISPLIKSKERATFMSVNSLVGRLGYGVVLFALSNIIAGNKSNWSTLSYLNQVGLFIALFGIIVLVVSGYFVINKKELD